MNIKVNTRLNIKSKEAQDTMGKAVSGALVEVVTLIAQEAIHESPKRWGTNMRSIAYEAEGKGTGKDLSTKKGQAAVYSTSGYGGYLETGTYKMAARPYFKPALDHHIGKLPGAVEARLK